MRVLALDYGSARCGCAVSDPTGTIVTPIETVLSPGTRRGLEQIEELCRKREVERVVVGLPLSLRGRDTEQTRQTREFASQLSERLELQVELHDERFTTRMAQRERGEGASSSASEDSRAAAHMLESWLAARSG
jgi:putative Holliday junction resolvase